MIVRRGLALTCLLALLIAGAPTFADEPAKKGAEPPAKKTKRWSDAKKQATFQLPATWAGKHITTNLGEQLIVELEVTLPEGAGQFTIELSHLKGMAEPIQQAFHEQPTLWKQWKADDATVIRTPRPHLRLDMTRDEEDWIRLHTFRYLEGRGFTLVLACPARLFDQLKDDDFAAVETVTTTLGPYPARPEGYERSERDGFVWYVHPLAKNKDVKDYRAYVAKLEKRFRKVHGKFPKEQLAEMAFIFHPRRSMAATFGTTYTGSDRSGHGVQIYERRVFATPIKVGDTTADADLRSSVWGLFLWRRYGSANPGWMYSGETLLQYVEGGKGAPLPAATSWLIDQDAEPAADFSVERPTEDMDATMHRKRQALYMALFHAGAARYRKAYKKFLKAIGDGADWSAAAAEHLLSLDQAKMRADAAKLLVKMRKSSSN